MDNFRFYLETELFRFNLATECKSVAIFLTYNYEISISKLEMQLFRFYLDTKDESIVIFGQLATKISVSI